MQRCLELAMQGLGNVAPNPMVGCVIVHDGKIIGEGFHQKFGEGHAEVNAIADAEGRIDENDRAKNISPLQQSTLYVNLEPCSHHGKTPPCADLIIAKGIPRVVIGSNDPNALVAGRGIEKLRAVGVEVTVGVLKEQSDFVNRRFLTYHTQKRPYIILKWAQSADGYMGLIEPKQMWLTNEASKKLIHKWRSEEQGIMVGTRTVEIDNPQLTTRLWTGNNPIRITIDKNLTLANTYSVFNDAAPTLVFNKEENSTNNNIERIKIDFTSNVEDQILHALHQRNLLSVIIEGGPGLLNGFVNRGLWDEARVFYTPHVLGTGKKAPMVEGKVLEEVEIEGDRLHVTLRNT